MNPRVIVGVEWLTLSDLIAWQKSMAFVSEVYWASDSFPRKETFGLTAQLRRAAVSVPSNVAEGQARLTPRDFRNFLGHARGSLAEAQTQIMIARDLGYLGPKGSGRLLHLAEDVARLINALQSSLKDSTADQRKPNN